MPCRILSILLLALIASTLATADDPDLASRLDREFARLGSEDVEEREAAAAAIAKEGRAANAHIVKRLETEKDPEVRAQLKHVLQQIPVVEVGSRKWHPMVTGVSLEASAAQIALSRDGRFVATAGQLDGRVILSDAKTGKPLHEFSGIRSKEWGGIGFSPDGRFLLALELGRPQRVRVWRTEDGAEQKALISEPAGQSIFLFHGENGLTLVADSMRANDSAAWIVDASGVTRVNGGMAISPDGSRVVELTWVGETMSIVVVHLRSTANGEEILNLVDRTERGGTVAPDASAWTSIRDGQVHVLPLQKDAKEVVFGEGVKSVAWAGKGFVTSHAGKPGDTLKLWRDGAVVWTVPSPEAGGKYEPSVASGVLVFWADSGRHSIHLGPTAILSLGTGEVLDRLGGGIVEVHDYESCLVAHEPERVRVYRGGKRVAEFGNAWEEPRGWPVSASNDVLVYGSGDNTVLCDLKAENPAEVALAPHTEPVNSLTWTREGLVLGGGARPALVDPVSGAVLKRPVWIRHATQFGHFVDLTPLGMDNRDELAISPDGDRVATWDKATVRVRDVAGLGKECRIPVENGKGDNPGGRLAFSPDGSLLAVTTHEEFLDIYDLKTERRIFRSGPFDNRITHLAFAPEGPTVVVAWAKGPTGRLSLFAPDGTSRGEFPWTAVPTHIAQGRWVVAAGSLEEAGESLFCIDLKSPAEPRRIKLAEGPLLGEVFVPPTGDRVLVDIPAQQKMFVVSCTEGLLGTIETARNRRGQTVRVLDDGTLLFLHPVGLQTLYGPTLELAATDPAIQGTVLEVAPDGKRIAVVNEGVVTVYEVK